MANDRLTYVPVKRPSFEEADTEHSPVDDRQVKELALRYKLLQGQVRGLIARYGIRDRAKLDAAAERLRSR